MPKKKILKQAKTSVIAQKQQLLKEKQKNKKSRKKRKTTGQEDLFKLERLINRRLPAEVRRNMGRPALQNQTGRFSNSVKLERFKTNSRWN